ncbi:heme-degrading domain-containing protein [Microbacterium sp. RD1]|uniref:heme-degrading domain-containing protein n=1 Tax=Microbacterium sp. RD1 TaxID=3457313 RepID=UPI003FA609CC
MSAAAASRDELPVYTAADIESEPVLDVARFDNDAAVDLGLTAVEVIDERGLNLAVRIVLHGDVVFQAKLGTTGPGNDPWLAGKAAVAEEFGEPSLLVKLRHLEAGTPFERLEGVDHDTLRAHGGAIPLRVRGELVGTITMSGEPDVLDHATAAEAVRRYLER